MYTFPPDAVTIVRKKGDDYIQDAISTRKMLPGSQTSDAKVRENVIEKLRRDPSVIVVLEDRDGRCEETFDHGGFSITVSVQGGEKAAGRLYVNYGVDVAYDKTFQDNPEEDSIGSSLIDEVLCELTLILEAIDREDYSFVSEDCPAFEYRDPGEEAEDLDDIASLLEENGYESERLHTVGFVDEPCLFVHENELLLFGRRHFSGDFFVEMKRLFLCVDADVVKEAVKEAAKGVGVRCFQYDDGSWGFRGYFMEDVYKSTFVNLLEEAVAELRKVVEMVESSKNIGEEIFDITREVRALFTYEVIDASMKLSHLHI